MELPLAAWVELGRRRRTLHLLVDMVRVVEVDMVDVVDMVESLGCKPSGTSTGGFTP